MNLETRQTEYVSVENVTDQQEEIVATAFHIIEHMNAQIEARMPNMGKLIKQLMIQNKELMESFVKQTPGGSGREKGSR